MSHPLDGCRAKVARAREHIKKLEGPLASDVKDRDYGIRVYQQSDPPQQVIEAKVTDLLLVEWAVIHGEIVHDLRSSLDHLVCALVRRQNANSKCANRSFPITNSGKEFADAVRKGSIRGVGRTARTLIESVQPYHADKGRYADDPLYVLHRMWVWDKHRTLLGVDPVWFLKPKSGTEGDAVALAPIQAFLNRKGPLEDGTKLVLDLAPEAAPDPEHLVPFELTMTEQFAKGIPGEGQPVAKTFNRLADAVDEVLRKFEPIF